MFNARRGRHFFPGIALLAGAVMIAGSTLLAGSAQNSPRVAMLEQAGWDAIKRNDLPVATATFKEAIALDPKNASLRVGAGMAAFLQRHDADAKSHYEQALQLDPKLTVARVQLGMVVRRQGDFQEAIRQFEIVAAEDPGHAAVRETLDRWKRERELHERMRLEVGDFFTVSFEGPEDAGLAAQALESLNRAYWRICDVFGVFPPKSVPVVLYTRRTISRRHAFAAVGRGRLRRHHSRADARRR